MAIIRFEHVDRVFHQNGQDFTALKDINLEVKDREFVAIVGPSGCGKTTCCCWRWAGRWPEASTCW